MVCVVHCPRCIRRSGSQNSAVFNALRHRLMYCGGGLFWGGQIMELLKGWVQFHACRRIVVPSVSVMSEIVMVCRYIRQ